MFRSPAFFSFSFFSTLFLFLFSCRCLYIVWVSCARLQLGYTVYDMVCVCMCGSDCYFPLHIDSIRVGFVPIWLFDILFERVCGIFAYSRSLSLSFSRCHDVFTDEIRFCYYFVFHSLVRSLTLQIFGWWFFFVLLRLVALSLHLYCILVSVLLLPIPTMTLHRLLARLFILFCECSSQTMCSENVAASSLFQWIGIFFLRFIHYLDRV